MRHISWLLVLSLFLGYANAQEPKTSEDLRLVLEEISDQFSRRSRRPTQLTFDLVRDSKLVALEEGEEPWEGMIRLLQEAELIEKGPLGLFVYWTELYAWDPSLSFKISPGKWNEILGQEAKRLGKTIETLEFGDLHPVLQEVVEYLFYQEQDELARSELIWDEFKAAHIKANLVSVIEGLDLSPKEAQAIASFDWGAHSDQLPSELAALLERNDLALDWTSLPADIRAQIKEMLQNKYKVSVSFIAENEGKFSSTIGVE